MKKLMLGVVTALTLSLSGCWGLTENVMNAMVTKTPKATNTDTVSGFVINKDDGKLIMIGQKFVYVFDDDEETETLKLLINSPRVSNMQWKIFSNTTTEPNFYKVKHYTPHALRVDKETQRFEFSVDFHYEVKTEQDRATINKISTYHLFHSSFPKNRTIVEYFKGQVYQDNSPIVQKARQNAQALSKQYTFTIYTVTNETSTVKTTAKYLALPFAIVGDIISSPIQMFDDLKGW